MCPSRWDLTMPIVSNQGQDKEPILVIRESPLKIRRAVEKIALYFKREFEYDFIQYDATERGDRTYQAHLWLSRPMYADSWPNRVGLGACCFRWREWEDAPHGWSLQWIWLHPYIRRTGLLTDAWPLFRRRYGDFFVEPPLSEAMERFLATQNTPQMATESTER